MTLHASTRPELLAGAGVLFAWPFVPKLARAEARAPRRDGRAFAVGPVTPLVVRGPAPVMSWTPRRIQPASEDTMARLLDLYHHTDTELARAIESRMDLVTLARAGDPAALAPT